MGKRFRFVLEQEHDVTSLRLLLQETKAQPRAVDGYGVLRPWLPPQVREATRKTIGEEDDLRRLTERFVVGLGVAVLREDPAGFHERMTFATRDRYRHVVERIAKRTRRSEESVARQAIECARAGPDAGADEAVAAEQDRELAVRC